MRRLVPIAAFALFLVVPVWAQRGGGHGGGMGGHGGFSGGHAGGFSGHAGFSGGHAGISTGRSGHSGHLSGGVHSTRGFTHSSRIASSRGPFLHDRLNDRFRDRGHGRFHDRDRDRFRTFGFRNCNGFGCRGGFGYPWWGWGFYDPWWMWDSGSSYDEDYERDRAIANDMNEQSLAEQRMLRQEEADGDQDSYSHRSDRQRAPSPSSSDDQQASATIPPTVLVFRDQHKREIQNYAIVGQTLWNFSPQHAEKIPLADLDLAATVKANDDRGITFKVPAPGEAQ